MKFCASIMYLALISVTVLSTNSFAENSSRLAIEGEAATKVINTLKKVGFSAQTTDYGDFVSASRVDCIHAGVGESVLDSCTAMDYQKHIFKIQDGDASALLTLLFAAGAKNQVTNTEATTLSVYALDCLDWNVVAQPGDAQQVPTCLFNNP
ncbi:MAG: hypothetical protein PHY93_18980 [Bacteriovorax sp.]|nr:hypothetical protein [Bacteriovorax sp.]